MPASSVPQWLSPNVEIADQNQSASGSVTLISCENAIPWDTAVMASTNVNTTGDSSLKIPPNRNGLIGKFLGFTTLDGAFSLGPVQPGYATVVALTH